KKPRRINRRLPAVNEISLPLPNIPMSEDNYLMPNPMAEINKNISLFNQLSSDNKVNYINRQIEKMNDVFILWLISICDENSNLKDENGNIIYTLNNVVSFKFKYESMPFYVHPIVSNFKFVSLDVEKVTAFKNYEFKMQYDVYLNEGKNSQFLKKWRKGKFHMVAGSVCIVDEYCNVLLCGYIYHNPDLVFDYVTSKSGLTEELMKHALPIEKIKPFINAIIENKTVIGAAIKNDFDSLSLKHNNYDDIQNYFYNIHPIYGKQPIKLSRLWQMYFPNHADIQKSNHSCINDAIAQMKLYQITTAYNDIKNNNL
ncbi:apoptosis-enhancing nuclease-like protein, partial [Leptotrombidium deliense]